MALITPSKSDDSSPDVNSAATAGGVTRMRMKLLIRSIQSVIQSVIPSATQSTEREDFTERQVITLDPQAWDDFVAALDAPPRALDPAVKALYARKPVWKR